MGDGGVFGFARTVRNDSGKATPFGEFDGFNTFRDGADLVNFNQDGIAGFFVDSSLEEFGVCD